MEHLSIDAIFLLIQWCHFLLKSASFQLADMLIKFHHTFPFAHSDRLIGCSHYGLEQAGQEDRGAADAVPRP